MNTLFDLPSSGRPKLEITVIDSAGRERASTTVPFILVVRNDTGLRQRIAELQENYTAQLLHGRSSAVGSGGGGADTLDMAIALDELQWFSTLFRHEKKVFSQGGVIAEVFRRFSTTKKKRCCLLVLNSVTSPPQWIRQPQLREMHDVFSFLPFGGLASCGCLRPCLFRHLSFLISPYAIQTYSRRHLSPYSLLRASASAPPCPSGTSVSSPPPPRLLLYTPNVMI
jgi:hypothetical protein